MIDEKTDAILPDPSPSHTESSSWWVSTMWLGQKILHGMEVVGEALADFFGITQSKYQYVIDAYERKQYELEMERKADEEAKTARAAAIDADLVEMEEHTTEKDSEATE